MRIPWTRWERRWRDALLEAMVPAEPEAELPGLAEVDRDRFWDEYEAHAPLLLEVGLRAAVWALTAAPAVTIGVARPFHHLTPADRQRVLERVEGARSSLIRQLPFTIKLVACFAHMRDPAVRARVEEIAGQ